MNKYIKYPRTYHLPWSVISKDDRMLESDAQFHGKEVIATLKMDGENTTMYNDYIHARSINSNNHESRHRVKGLWAGVRHLIDPDMRICGENMYAVHTIQYNDLQSYFYIFSIWIKDQCLDWKQTEEIAALLGFPTVEVFYTGEYNRVEIEKRFSEHSDHEGYVIRLASSFLYTDFQKSVAKFVKQEFRQTITDQHWTSKRVIPNRLKT